MRRVSFLFLRDSNLLKTTYNQVITELSTGKKILCKELGHEKSGNANRMKILCQSVGILINK